MTFKLNEILNILEPLAIKGNLKDIIVEKITDDSREATLKTLFFAIQGVKYDGHCYLKTIQDKIVAAVVEYFVEDALCPQILVKSSKDAYLKILEFKEGTFLKDFSFVGITGTNGKTTFTYLMESILKACGKQAGVIGTVNYRCGDLKIDALNTTPDAKNLLPLLKEFYKTGCRDIVMEVSSHGLKQGRLRGIVFDAACFSNLTPEHLDYHIDMEDYYLSKKLLFTNYLKKDGVAVINLDDVYGERLFNEIEHKNKYGFSFTKEADFESRVILSNTDCMEIEVKTDNKKYCIKTELKGKFNAYNVVSAFTVATLLGYDKSAVTEGIYNLKRVPGRLEEVKNELGISVFIDYAHTPDALLNILKTAKELANGKLIVVFGCGGDRDKSKRPVMGKIASELADVVIITSDNPRTEDPLAIIEDIKKGLLSNKRVIIQPDREKAIFDSLFSAKKGDLILIAGKGHEDYQIVGEKKLHFSDQEVAQKALEKRRCLEQH